MPSDDNPVPLNVEGDYVEWSCGCTTDTERETRALIIVPCGPNCVLYRYVVDRMREMGKPTYLIEAEDLGGRSPSGDKGDG